jgi:hydroxymethylglutaryl-CoA reductase (NADPH)
MKFVNRTIGAQAEEYPRLPNRGIYTEEARVSRLEYLRRETQCGLEAIARTSIDARKVVHNIEDFIGCVEVPMGVAGPLAINGSHARGSFYLPLATTEGALVASMNRGAKAVTLSGGATAAALQQKMLRAPVFMLADLHAALRFVDWVRPRFADIFKVTKEHSEHAHLKEIRPTIFGRSVHLSFVYETGDASGQNMVTTCTWHACQWILEQLERDGEIGVLDFCLEGNLSSDKKASYRSFLDGRGVRAVADVAIPEAIVKSVLKTSSQAMVRLYREAITGALQAGVTGANVNTANAIASIFIATGQDVACTVESCVCVLNMEQTSEGLYASILMPCLVIGTVGGGTGLRHQRESLELMGCFGAGKVRKFAEVIAAACLALELSTVAAFANGQFAYAHERLGRNRPELYVQRSELGPELIQSMMRGTSSAEINVMDVRPATGHIGSSLITQLAADRTAKLLGHLPYTIDYEEAGRRTQANVLLKVKPTDEEVLRMLNTVANHASAELGTEWRRQCRKTEFANSHIREVEIYQERDPRFTRYVPHIYGVYRNDKREAFIIMEELLSEMVLMDSAGDVSGWRSQHIEAAISGIASVHALWYRRDAELGSREWLAPFRTARQASDLGRLYELLAVNAHAEFPEWVCLEDVEYARRLIASSSSWWGAIDQMPKTLIHNDFNPRNICFRKDLRLCAYDWELATIHLPQYDVAELLAFVLSRNTTKHEVRRFVDYHRLALERAAGVTIHAADWWEGFRCCMQDFYLFRLGMYLMCHSARHFDFLERVVATTQQIMRIVR